jgi:hypothetical protein
MSARIVLEGAPARFFDEMGHRGEILEMNVSSPVRRRVARAAIAGAWVLMHAPFVSGGEDEGQPKEYRGLLGASSWKVRAEDGKTYLWAGGDRSGPGAQWYDFTGAKIPVEQLQFGIGKDRIRSIDDPLFVSPDDPRLLELPPSPYRREEKPKTNDDIMVIGVGEGRDARAYPTALLDHHELVNDRIAGKPVTVGW